MFYIPSVAEKRNRTFEITLLITKTIKNMIINVVKNK